MGSVHLVPLNVDKGDAVTRTEYKPYGETWVQEGDKTNRPKFNSQELDPETGYYFYNARYYEAEIGRFITADNIIDGEYSTQGWNRFSYVKNNPVRYKDPSGHLSKEQNFANFGNNFATIDDSQHVEYKKEFKFGPPVKGLDRKEQMRAYEKGGEGLITSPFGRRRHPLTGRIGGHNGIDLGLPNGTKILAAEDGKISFGENNPDGGIDANGNKIRGWGYYAVIDHGNGFKTLYAHMNKDDYNKYKALYKKSNNVRKGDEIGGVGNSGGSTGNHLHFEIRKDAKGNSLGVPIDPKNIIKDGLK